VQLDRTRIAIRERGLLEILDLSLQVVRAYARPLCLACMAGALPFALLNEWLIGWMTDHPNVWLARGRYFWVMTLLVFIEAPLAVVPITLYLGDAMFLQQTSAWRIATGCWKLLPRLLLCQGVLRGVLPALFLVWTVGKYGEFSASEVFLSMLAFYVVVIRAVRPYLNEIVLLERNPLGAGRGGTKTLTIARRSAALHNPNAGDLLGRWVGSFALAVLLTMAFVYTCWFMWGTFLNDWDWGPVMVHVCVPLSMWLVAGYFGVVRFLSYLDLRIRREGWEVELRVRAEAARLAGQME